MRISLKCYAQIFFMLTLLFLVIVCVLLLCLQTNIVAVKQIDLVPTLSLLMGLPIPYSNLGMVITDFFTDCHNCNKIVKLKLQVNVLSLNAKQVRKYLHSYSQLSDEFPFAKMEQLEKIYQSATQMYNSVDLGSKKDNNFTETETKLIFTAKNYKLFLQEARKMCEGIWAKFDHLAMICGAVCFILTFVFYITMMDPSCFNSLTIIAIVGNVLVLPAVIVLVLSNPNILISILYFLMSIGAIPVGAYLLFSTTSSSIEKKTQFKWFKLTPELLINEGAMLLFLCYLFGLLSNSFVVYEDSVTSFFIQSFVWLLFVKVNTHLNITQSTTKLFSKGSNANNLRKLKQFDIGRIITSPRTLALMLTLTICALIKLASHFRMCREEQWTCEMSNFMQPLSAITDDLRAYKNLRYFFAVFFIILVPILTIKWMRHHGNLNGATPVSLVVQYLLPLSTTCVAFHWAVQAMSDKLTDKMLPWQQTLFAKGEYVLFILSIFVIIMNPLCVYLLPKEQKSLPFTNSEDDNFMPKMYNHMKLNWKQYLHHKNSNTESSDDIPIVYGLSTVYSAPVISIVALSTVCLAMLLNDGIAPGAIIQLLVMAVFLELYACSVNLKKPKSGEKCSIFKIENILVQVKFHEGLSEMVSFVYKRPTKRI